MSKDVKTEFKWDEAKLARIRRRMTEALWDLGFDAEAHAKSAAPVDSGALVDSIRTTKTDSQVIILAGGTASGYNVPYARFREYNNNLHPNTRFYMRNALEWASNNISKYFKDITK